MTAMQLSGPGGKLVVMAWHSVEATWRYPAPAGNGLRNFIRQMRMLRRIANVVPLDSALRSLERGDPLPPRAVALTFDDGYRDNLTLAAPVLHRLGLPATVYLVPDFLSGTGDPWWERLAWAFGRAAVPSVEFGGRTWSLATKQLGEQAHLAVESSLKPFDLQSRKSAVDDLVDRLEPRGSFRLDDLFLDWDGAHGLVRSGISIGSHTLGHPILARESEESQRCDLHESRLRLRDGLHMRVDTLAYPNGQPTDYDDRTIAAAAAAGYTHAVTAWGGINTSATPRYEVQRMMVSTRLSSRNVLTSLARLLVSGPEGRDGARYDARDPHRSTRTSSREGNRVATRTANERGVGR